MGFPKNVINKKSFVNKVSDNMPCHRRWSSIEKFLMLTVVIIK